MSLLVCDKIAYLTRYRNNEVDDAEVIKMMNDVSGCLVISVEG